VKVVITRAEEDSKSIAKLLLASAKQEQDIFYLPCLEFTPPDDNYVALDAAIRRNQEFDWLVFLSKRAADSFFSRILDLGAQFFHLAQHLKIAVVGAKTKDFIETNVNFPVDFCPSKFNSDSFSEEFKEKFTDDSNYLSPLKLLIPRTSIADNKLIEDLESSKKIEVTQVDAYKTIKPELNDQVLADFKALVLEAKANNEKIQLTLTSSECVRNFFDISSAVIDIKEFQPCFDFYSIGPKVSASLRQEMKNRFGLQNIEIKESGEATLDSLLSLLN